MKDKPARRESIDLETIRSGFNLFEDDGTLSQEDKDHISYKVQPTPRSRPSSMVKTLCTSCKTEHIVAKGLIPEDGFVCNDCLVEKING